MTFRTTILIGMNLKIWMTKQKLTSNNIRRICQDKEMTEKLCLYRIWDYGLYKYSFEVEDQGDKELAKVITGEVSGFSRAAFDLSCHADGTF